MAFPTTGVIWMNGSLVKWADAKIHIASHVIHYGSGIFEGARCYDTPKGTACFRLDAHTARLYNSAKIYRMPIPIEPAAMNEAIFRAGALRVGTTLKIDERRDKEPSMQHKVAAVEALLREQGQ